MSDIKYHNFELTETQQCKLAKLPETGMDYQIISVHLKDGTIVPNVTVVGGRRIINVIGFTPDDIEYFTMTNPRARTE